MSFESAFLSLMNSTVTVSTRSGHNNYGEPTYAAGVNYRARIHEKAGFVRTADGEVIEVVTEVWVNSTKAFTVDDRVTLPNGTVPQVVAVNRPFDEDGVQHHVKFMLGH
jgi:uncharacterized membrane protein